MFQLTQRRPVAQIVSLVALLAALMLVLTACSGGGSEKKVTYTNSGNGVESTMEIYSEGDNVTKQVIKSVINYEEAGVKDKKEAEELYSPTVKEYENIKGVTHKVSYSDTEATETFTVDYKTADLKEISELTGAEYDESQGKNVSLKETLEVVEQSGYTKKE